jgi:hypothetical protein
LLRRQHALSPRIGEHPRPVDRADLIADRDPAAQRGLEGGLAQVLAGAGHGQGAEREGVAQGALADRVGGDHDPHQLELAAGADAIARAEIEVDAVTLDREDHRLGRGGAGEGQAEDDEQGQAAHGGLAGQKS